MQLESISIIRNSYGFVYENLQPGETGGKIKLSCKGGDFTVILQPHHVGAILQIVSGALVEHTRAVAQDITREVIEHVGVALPAPVDGPFDFNEVQ
jgi:hypothetical protein